jgi:L-alanine-DL-glutamate epimerase-like enolase superfamily enzyme
MTDPVWVGGVSEARRVGDLASLHQRPFTPHDCTGPVSLAVGVHLCLTAETAIFQEIVRAFYFGWYREFATGLPPLDGGRITASAAPGHGVELRPEIRERARVRTSQ